MPLFKSRKERKEDKSKLQQKLTFSRDTPDPVFDISDCSIHAVPSGVYSLCKVFLKEALRMNGNCLSSLEGGGNLQDLNNLIMLDIHSNCFEFLPEQIGFLRSLQYLDISENKLKELPQAISQLKSLKQLKASSNKLKSLPDGLGRLTRLELLDLRENQLTKVPLSACGLSSLSQFLLDGNPDLTYPPPAVFSQGAQAIFQFLCSESNMTYIPTVDAEPSENLPTGSTSQEYLQLEEEKKKELATAQKQLEELQMSETMAAQRMKQASHQLLEDIKNQEMEMEKQIKKLQQEKDKQRDVLMTNIKSLDDHSKDLIASLLVAGRKQKLRRSEQESILDQKIQEEDLRKLKRQNILVAMQAQLEEALEQEALVRCAFNQHGAITQSILEGIGSSEEQVADILAGKTEERKHLVQELLKGEALQQQMLLKLLLSQDEQRQHITKQLEAISNELAMLSQAELQQKAIRLEGSQVALEERRKLLTSLMDKFLARKAEREKELTDALKAMEQRKEDELADFWLVQYQRLLDSKPGILCSLDWVLKSILEEVGAHQYIPQFARHKVTAESCISLTEDDLKSMGIRENELRKALMKEFIILAQEQAYALKKLVEPSAPPSEALCETLPSAPPGDTPSAPLEKGFVVDQVYTVAHIETECVICMDAMSSMVFLPCGHVCCCNNCSGTVSNCPMCRSPICHRILLVTSDINQHC